MIARYRTVADRDTVTARTLLGSETSAGTTSPACGSAGRAWALARLTDGSELQLPAVTFATLPAADRRQRRTSAQPLRVAADGYRRGGCAPLSSTQIATPAPDAQHQRGERADERPTGPAAAGVQTVPAGTGQDDRRDRARSSITWYSCPSVRKAATAGASWCAPSPPPAGR